MFVNNGYNDHVRPILYYDDINPHSRAVLMILSMLDVDIELRPIEMIRGEHLKPAYSKINPAHTVPTMVHNDLVITGNAIFFYVCENNDNEKASQLIAFKCYKRHCCILSRLFFESQVLNRIHGHLMTDLVRKTIFQTDIEYHQKKVEYAYDAMEAYLNDGAFMAGSVLTAADISFLACLGALDMMFPIDVDRKRWEKLNDWYRRMRSLSIQKINTNGIEKQRQIVEHFSKFQFTSDVKRFTSGVRDSLIPRFPSHPERCSVSVQTVVRPEIPSTTEQQSVANFSLNNNNKKSATYMEDQNVQQAADSTSAPAEARSTSAEVVATISANEIYKVPSVEMTKIFSNPIDISPLQKHVGAEAPNYPPPPPIQQVKLEPIDNYIGNPVVTAQYLQVKNGLMADRSSGGAHKEKPPVPPKRKKNATLVLEKNTGEINKDIVVVHFQNISIQETAAKSTKRNETQTFRNTIENQLDFNDNGAGKTSKPEIMAADNQMHSLTRLNGGIESMVLIDVPEEKGIIIPPLMVSRLISPTNLTESKVTTIISKTTLNTPEINIPDSEECSKVSQKHISKESDFLPPPSLINGKQMALSYSRGTTAPNLPLTAPPPSPENHSQDEFPPPPSELLIPKPTSRVKVPRSTKLLCAKAVDECHEKALRKAIGAKPTTVSANESTTKHDSKSLTGRKTATQESKICKPSKKINYGGLFASGTKSPCSNISEASLGVKQSKNVHKKEVKNVCTKIPAKILPNAKNLDKKILEANSGSGMKIINGTESTAKGIQKASGRTFKNNEIKVFKPKDNGKQQRVEGGGQAALKGKTIPLTAKVVTEFMRSSVHKLDKPTEIVAKLETFTKVGEQNKREELSTVKASATNKTQTNNGSRSVSKEIKATNPNIVLKNSRKVNSTQIRNPAKVCNNTSSPSPTKNFDNSPYKPALGFIKSPAKKVGERKVIAKVRRKKVSKVANQEIINQKPISSTLALTVTRPESQNSIEEQIDVQKNELEQTTLSSALTSPPIRVAERSADAPVSVGLVAKVLHTLGTATSNANPPFYQTNEELRLPPKPLPPLPPPPLPFETLQDLPMPLPPPPTPPSSSLPSNDILPQAGTIAKALQSLGAITAVGKPFCGPMKPFHKVALQTKSQDSPVSSAVISKAPKENIYCIAEEARPLADVLTATVQQINKKRIDETEETVLIDVTPQSLTKKKTDSDILLIKEDPVMQKMEIHKIESLKPVSHTMEMPSTCVNFVMEDQSVRHNAEQSRKELNTTEESLKEAAEPSPKTKIFDHPTKEVSILEPQAPDPLDPTSTAGTEVPKLPEGLLKTKDASKNPSQEPSNYRYILERAMIEDDLVYMEPTPLQGQPNIIITGYTRVQPKTIDSLFVGRGRPTSIVMPPTLEARTKRPCTHGPSANVVLSTFGYTPMSELESIPENLLPPNIKPIYDKLLETPPKMASLLDSTSNVISITETTAASAASTPILPSTMNLRSDIEKIQAHSSRIKAERPYPTAHRSRSQRANERGVNIKGREV